MLRWSAFILLWPGLRILLVISCKSTSGSCLSSLTMATLRPNWFLISPVLIASGQWSLMTWYSSAGRSAFLQYDLDNGKTYA